MYIYICASGTVCIDMLIRYDIPFHVARVRRSQPPQVDSYGSSTLRGCRWKKKQRRFGAGQDESMEG